LLPPSPGAAAGYVGVSLGATFLVYLSDYHLRANETDVLVLQRSHKISRVKH